MNTLFIDKNVYSIAGNWDELEAAQTLQLVPLLQARKPAIGIRLRALLILLKTKKSLRMQWKLRQVSDEDLFDMLRLTDFLWESRNFTTQKFPIVGKLHGPGDNFQYLNFVEYTKAEQHYLDFSKKADVAYLDKMIACLWRPASNKTAHGDKRERYDDDIIPQRLPAIAAWPLEQKLAVYLWFDSCRQELTKLFPKVFSGKDKGTFQPGKRPKGWIDVATTLAENVTNVEEVLYTDLFVVMLFLSNKIEEAEEMERKYSKK